MKEIEAFSFFALLMHVSKQNIINSSVPP